MVAVTLTRDEHGAADLRRLAAASQGGRPRTV
jgi:hypothetical protein